MGVDCRITIPAPARVRDVASVLGILHGCTKIMQPINSKSEYCDVEGVKVTTCDNMPECCRIQLSTGDGREWQYLYHFEFDALGNHGMLPRSRPTNIALAVALVDFFGGSVTYQDYAEVPDYQQPVREDIHAEDGQPWDALQARMFNVQPITPDDCKRYIDLAAYEDYIR